MGGSDSLTWGPWKFTLPAAALLLQPLTTIPGADGSYSFLQLPVNDISDHLRCQVPSHVLTRDVVVAVQCPVIFVNLATPHHHYNPTSLKKGSLV